ncbi:hypothetical protein AB0H88_13815 [Nonomuraea sp. NPDC050680]|uniref:hypothetical protein n=1 Tax=Nonomuraea sp. NPDC050680 TaxID=3154630 RepID=UPI0033FBC484
MPTIASVRSLRARASDCALLSPGYPDFVIVEQSAAPDGTDSGTARDIVGGTARSSDTAHGAARSSDTARGAARPLRARSAALLLALAVAGCAQSPADPEADAPVGNAVHSSDAAAAPTTLTGAGVFKPRTTMAIVYNRKLVPKGAQASVTAESTGGKTVTSLVVEGLVPNHRYGAHLHVAPCGKGPAAAGAHFQHIAGRADATSEVWLDLKTDGSGAGRATARHDWPLTGAMPHSLVLHARPTAPSDPPAPRIACLTLN